MSCVCGHPSDDHDLTGQCRVPDCRCEQFQPGDGALRRAMDRGDAASRFRMDGTKSFRGAAVPRSQRLVVVRIFADLGAEAPDHGDSLTRARGPAPGQARAGRQSGRCGATSGGVNVVELRR